MRKQSAIVGSGFMVSYACTAKCRHCMYGCSYLGNRDYVTPAATNCDLCYKIRCFLRKQGEYREIGPDCFYEMMET
ncbi:MAG: hypothetical protein IJL78_01305 [Lachnospiraceae bacterium]|nr:hypothetical protein [Lachnospiraceae bacterium]